MTDEVDGKQTRMFSKTDLTVTYDIPARTRDQHRPESRMDRQQGASSCLPEILGYITHHGTYIDGFAVRSRNAKRNSMGRQACARKQAALDTPYPFVRCQPRASEEASALAAEQPQFDDKGRRINRDINVYHGNFNQKLREILQEAEISENEATFCLLDQRTFECDWASVAALAQHKQTGNKIELFYFLAIGWLERALSGIKDTDKLVRWWGRSDWTSLKGMRREALRDEIVNRLKTDFRYQSVKAYPIYNRDSGGAIMYYMIHATDHPEAPIQMARAYRNVVRPDGPYEDQQLDLFVNPNRRNPMLPSRQRS